MIQHSQQCLQMEERLLETFPINRMRVLLCLQTVLHIRLIRCITLESLINDHELCFQHRESMSKCANHVAKCETIVSSSVIQARENSY